MENKQDCTKVYSIKGYAVQDNGIVRNSYGEYIGQLSDLEECEAKDAEIASLTGQVAKLKEQLARFIDSEKQISDAYLRIRTLVDAWDTNEGGENRFEVTENKIKDLKKQVDKLSGSYGWVSYEKMADENRELKKQLEEIEKSAYGLVIEDMHSSSKFAKVLTKAEFAKRVGRKIDAMQEKIPKLESQLKAKEELLEKMRVALEDIKKRQEENEIEIQRLRDPLSVTPDTQELWQRELPHLFKSWCLLKETYTSQLKAKDEILEKMREIIITISGGVADNMEVYRAKEIVDTACEQALALLPKPLNKEVKEKGN